MLKKLKIKEWIKAILFAVLLVYILFTFCFQIFTIPTSSMEKTLLPGDFIFVSKLHYGPRIPLTPLNFPLCHQTLPFSNIKSYLEWINIPYARILGFSKIKQNDVVVFNYPVEDEHPVDHRTYFVKRCIGVPGNTIEIRGGYAYVNDSLIEEPENVQYNYHIKISSGELIEDSLTTWGITEGGKISKNGDYSLSLTYRNALHIQSLPNVSLVEKFVEKPGMYADYIFPNNEKIKWNVDWFGPVVIPMKGDTIHIGITNLPIYRRLIETYEENKLEVKNDSIYINDSLAAFYVPKMNYYFMMGDNRHNSADSRFWGFVPEDHIVGKAMYITFSINRSGEVKEENRKGRWFSKIK